MSNKTREIIISFIDYVAKHKDSNFEFLRTMVDDFVNSNKNTKKINIDLDKIKVGTICGYMCATDTYAYKIKEYKVLPRNTHLLYLESLRGSGDNKVFKYNKNDKKWYLFEDNKFNKKRQLDFTITETYLDPNF